jgi:hypothetical protein
VKSGTSGDQNFIMGIGTAGVTGAGVIAGDANRAVTGTTSSSWTEYSFEFVAGADGNDLDNYQNLWCEKSTSTTATMLFDTVRVIPLGAIAEYDGASVTAASWYDKSGNGRNGTVTGATLHNKIAALDITDLYTSDLHLANERGDWTVIEEENYLTLRNNKTDKVYKLVMEEIE